MGTVGGVGGCLFKPPTKRNTIKLQQAHARNIRVATADGQSLGGWHLLPTHRLAAEVRKKMGVYICVCVGRAWFWM